QLLPGLQVNVDGTIYYQGRQVSGVRVNNKDFFAQDLTLATRNLDASLVDVVQVINDKGDSKREILDDSDLPIVINLKTKREFVKADFGKFYGSGGSRDRYEARSEERRVGTAGSGGRARRDDSEQGCLC